MATAMARTMAPTQAARPPWTFMPAPDEPEAEAEALPETAEVIEPVGLDAGAVVVVAAPVPLTEERGTWERVVPAAAVVVAPTTPPLALVVSVPLPPAAHCWSRAALSAAESWAASSRHARH